MLASLWNVCWTNGLVLRATAGHYVPVGGDTIVQAVPQQMHELSIGTELWVLLTSHDKVVGVVDQS